MKVIAKQLRQAYSLSNGVFSRSAIGRLSQEQAMMDADFEESDADLLAEVPPTIGFVRRSGIRVALAGL